MGSNESATDLARNYDRAAWFYELSAAAFSFGKIRASKKYAVHQVPAGKRVLFLGVGSGEDAILAARRGLQVTCLDLSQRMLDGLQRQLDREGLSAEIICGDAFEHHRTGYYDAVCANYFLNVFFRPDMERMVRHCATLVGPGGLFLVADVSPAQGIWPARLFNVVYLKLAMVTFWLAGLVPLHRTYDYTAAFPDAGWQLDHIRYFRILKWGPILFRTIVARRSDGALECDQRPVTPVAGEMSGSR